MSAAISLTQTQIFTGIVSVLGTFGLVATSGSVPIVRGQVNRVPEPAGQDFVVVWPIARDRLAMNIDTWADTTVTGAIVSNVMTVSVVTNGAVAPGLPIYGANVATGCQVVAQLTGTPGGAGTYSTTATPNASGPLYLGTISAMQETEVTIQADVHGPNSADNAARVAILWRDQFGVSAFDTLGLPMGPLYTSEPRQIPFTNAEQQWEERWVVDLCLQANVAIATTMQFADELVAETVPVESLAA